MSGILAGLAGGLGSIGSAVGDTISEIIYQVGKFIRLAIRKIYDLFRVLLHYLSIYARIFAGYLGKLYSIFARDPVRFLQFTGSLAIMTYYGLL